MSRILLIGEGPELLKRAPVLFEATGANISHCSASELARHLPCDFDLVIVCHTFAPGVIRSLVMSDVYRRWPQTPVLQVMLGEETFSVGMSVDAHMSPVKPNELVNRVEQLLRKPPVGTTSAVHRAVA